MRTATLDLLRTRPLPLGIGCSRFGSFTGADEDEARAILSAGLERGVTVLDTADIYGQGESERIVGRFLRAASAPLLVVTKVGQVYPWKGRVMQPLKRLLRSAVRRWPAVEARLRQSRSGSLPKDFSKAHILRAAERSLWRLGIPQVDVLLLHGPSIGDLRKGEATEALVAAQRLGKARLVGVSCDDLETARHTIADARFDAIQIPISLTERRFMEVARAARARGMLVIGREVLGGPRPAGDPPLDPRRVAEIMRQLIAEDCADVLLIGTTNAGRFRTLLDDLAACSVLIGPTEEHVTCC